MQKFVNWNNVEKYISLQLWSLPETIFNDFHSSQSIYEKSKKQIFSNRKMIHLNMVSFYNYIKVVLKIHQFIYFIVIFVNLQRHYDLHKYFLEK